MASQASAAPPGGQVRGTAAKIGTDATFVAQAYRDHRVFVFRALARLGVLDEALEDAVHDVFLILHRRRADFEGRSSVRTWLYGIALRVARDRRARSERRRRAEPRSPIHVEAAADLHTPEQVSSDREALRLVDAVLERMDPARREVFVLHELERLEGTEIARIVGAKRNTVYSRLRLARRDFTRLAEELTAGGKQDRHG